MSHLYIFLTIVFTVYGQLIIKQQVQTIQYFPEGWDLVPFYVKFIFTRPLVLSGFVSAALASMAWIGALSKFELSYAYPYMSLNFVCVVCLSFFLFKEEINIYKVVGLLVICLGVWIVSKGS